MRLLIALFMIVPVMAQWPQFRGNQQLTGLSTEKIPAQLKLLWTWEGGEVFESSPVIDNGVVYIGSGASELIALDINSGKLLWKFKTGKEVGESTA